MRFQGKIEYQGGTHVLVRILSGVLIALTTVYGYMLSQRAIHAVLKNASGASLGANGGKDGEAGSLKGGGSNSSNGSCPQTPLTRSMSLSMTTIVEHRDLESEKLPTPIKEKERGKANVGKTAPHMAKVRGATLWFEEPCPPDHSRSEEKIRQTRKGGPTLRINGVKAERLELQTFNTDTHIAHIVTS
eukprot:1150437-Pelagomonas_calceolata.AAC.2